MAVNNSLVAKKQGNNAVHYMAGATEITLTPSDVKNYLVSGNKDAVTMQEVVVFINLCRYCGLNPWTREAYCIKYGSSEPATMVVGKEAFQKRAEANPAYDGAEAGVITLNQETGAVAYRIGTLVLPNEQLLGGYAEVWRKDRTHSVRIEVGMDEYIGRRKDGTVNSQWAKRPATMIRKVALVQALRESFPSAFGGMFTAEEQGVPEENLPPVLPAEQEPAAADPKPAAADPKPVGNSAAAALFG